MAAMVGGRWHWSTTSLYCSSVSGQGYLLYFTVALSKQGPPTGWAHPCKPLNVDALLYSTSVSTAPNSPAMICSKTIFDSTELELWLMGCMIAPLTTRRIRKESTVPVHARVVRYHKRIIKPSQEPKSGEQQTPFPW
jgi:hypothetical protein